MADVNSTTVREKTPAQRRIAALTEKIGLPVVRMSVSDADAEAVRRVRRWETGSRKKPAVRRLTGRG